MKWIPHLPKFSNRVLWHRYLLLSKSMECLSNGFRPSRGACRVELPCGENGEFHTFVLGGCERIAHSDGFSATSTRFSLSYLIVPPPDKRCPKMSHFSDMPKNLWSVLSG